MDELGSIWQGTARDARLGEARSRRLERACRHDPALADELDFLVAHLSADLGGTFLRAFVVQLERATGREEALMLALGETIRATPWPRARSRGGSR